MFKTKYRIRVFRAGTQAELYFMPQVKYPFGIWEDVNKGQPACTTEEEARQIILSDKVGTSDDYYIPVE